MLFQSMKETGSPPAWKRVDSKELGIHNSMIGISTRKVLNGLKKRGTIHTPIAPHMCVCAGFCIEDERKSVYMILFSLYGKMC